MKNGVYEKARAFVYCNARPLDLALWRYHFDGGSKQDVLDILTFYQNADGGFGHAIEPDFWNTNSTPIATWQAITALNEVGVRGDEDIVVNILAYLDSGKDFDGERWYNSVRSNNDFPHAVWWECNSGIGAPSDNPTVGLAGFALKYANKGSSLYKKATAIASKAAKAFIAAPVCDMHITRLYLELYEYCAAIPDFDLFDRCAYKSALYTAIKNTVCSDPNKWLREYVCTPSFFFDNSELVFDILGRDLCVKEGEMLLNEQLDDGSYSVPWLWYKDYTEYYVAANWWKSAILRKNMLYLKKLKMI